MQRFELQQWALWCLNWRMDQEIRDKALAFAQWKAVGVRLRSLGNAGGEEAIHFMPHSAMLFVCILAGLL